MNVFKVDNQIGTVFDIQRKERTDQIENMGTAHIVGNIQVLKTTNVIPKDLELRGFVGIGSKQTLLDFLTKRRDVRNDTVDFGFSLLLE